MLTAEDMQLLIAGFSIVILYTLWPVLLNIWGRFQLQKTLINLSSSLGLRLAKRPENPEQPDWIPVRLVELPRGTAWIIHGNRRGMSFRFWVDLEAFVDPFNPKRKILWRLTVKAVWKSPGNDFKLEEILVNRSEPKGRDFPLAKEMIKVHPWIVSKESMLG